MSIPDGLLGEWCSALGRHGEMPAEAYLATGVATVAAIVGPRLSIRWGPTRGERCNLWLLNVGRSALARKTTGMSAARWAIGVARAQLGDQVRWYGAKRLSDAQLAADLDVVGADTARAQAEEDTIAEAERRRPRRLEPIHRRVPVSWLMGLNEVAPLWGEGAREWQQATQALLLEVYDGQLASRTRATTVAEQETCVSALGNIPPAELAARTSTGTLTSGFAGRWLVMPSPGPRRPEHMPAMNGADPLAALRELIERLAGMARRCEGQDVVRLWTPEAIAARRSWYDALWHELAAADATSAEVAARADVFGRVQASALKLATIAAVCREIAEVEEIADVRVGAEDAEWAQGVVDASMATLMEVVADNGGGAASPLGRAENRVLGCLRRRGADREERAISLRDAARWARGSDSYADMVRSMEVLRALGAVEIAETGTTARGGRPGRVVWLAGSGEGR